MDQNIPSLYRSLSGNEESLVLVLLYKEQVICDGGTGLRMRGLLHLILLVGTHHGETLNIAHHPIPHTVEEAHTALIRAHTMHTTRECTQAHLKVIVTVEAILQVGE